MNDIDRIREICLAKLQYDDVYVERLDYELDVIEDLGFSRIFLIVHELMNFARREGIRIGPGRGSAAASLVCWLLGITALDPIKYRLDFHRFLIKGRVSLPDIDIDIEISGRLRILEHLGRVVGTNHIAKIGTFSIIHERGALREVARILEQEDPQAYAGLNIELNSIVKLIPHRIGGDRKKASMLKKVTHEIPDLKRFYHRFPKLFHIADRLVGQPRHTSVHPAGVLIVNHPVSSILPLQRDEVESGTPITQWEMKDTDKQKLFKLDLLALEALDFITECCRISEDEVSDLEPTDRKVFKSFANGNVDGIFQFDKDYLRSVFRSVGIDCFDDLVALNALIRPGAKTTNSLDEYAKRKKGLVKQNTLPGKASDCVKDTYGLILFQEQAMLIARECAGFTVEEADDLRKGIAKDYDTSRTKGKFIEGCLAQGSSEKESDDLWQILENAGKYMFNRAHSTCYSYIAYQMMWLKVYYPKQYWTAMLNSGLRDDMKFRKHLNSIKKLNYEVDKVGIFRSRARCYYDTREDKIVLGFLSVKGVGEKAALELESCGDAQSLEEWTTRVNRRTANSKTLDVLITNGAFRVFDKTTEELRELLAKKKSSGGGKKHGKKISEMYLIEEFDEKPKRETLKEALKKFGVE